MSSFFWWCTPAFGRLHCQMLLGISIWSLPRGTSSHLLLLRLLVNTQESFGVSQYTASSYCTQLIAYSALYLNAAMTLYFLAELSMVQLRVWVRNRCLKNILDHISFAIHGTPDTPITYRQLRQHCHRMMDIIDQLVVDPSSVVSHVVFITGSGYIWWLFLQKIILSDESLLGRQFKATFCYVYFDDPISLFRRAKELARAWPGFFLRANLPKPADMHCNYVDPEHIPVHKEIHPFLTCFYHHNEAVALIIIDVSRTFSFWGLH